MQTNRIILVLISIVIITSIVIYGYLTYITRLQIKVVHSDLSENDFSISRNTITIGSDSNCKESKGYQGFDIYWGDGIYSLKCPKTHTYNAAGRYIIRYNLGHPGPTDAVIIDSRKNIEIIVE